jgi:hypothetical protein
MKCFWRAIHAPCSEGRLALFHAASICTLLVVLLGRPLLFILLPLMREEVLISAPVIGTPHNLWNAPPPPSHPPLCNGVGLPLQPSPTTNAV